MEKGMGAVSESGVAQVTVRREDGEQVCEGESRGLSRAWKLKAEEAEWLGDGETV